ncbi:DUF3857 domain-containing protein [Winogradskyella litoriviva]|uniref:DUF3857 domain-containing protein n=1 Tax=Winogradskyella litoriviva TaxID=1220182 RepID=A0ABX2E5X1_9FLAO|nr:DUF3857 domain-containing protein [Winogradskyella litoriviva]NRD23452.1 DUF3857 domain-containing protein [Winogradskyella litoriviva]
MKKSLLTLILVLISITASAQLYKSHDWEENQEFYELNTSELKEPSVAIKEKYLIQYYQPVLGRSFKLFETKHSIIRINTEKGIKSHNRVYIPMRNVKRVIDIKARVTQSNGDVKYLDKNNIKELENVKNYGGFKIFAIEGLTKDSQLEFIYTLENKTTSLGSIVIQKEYFVKEAVVIIRKPRALKYRVKGYNGFPNMQTEKVDGNKEALITTVTNVKGMTDESNASPSANRMKVLYQVAVGIPSDSQMWRGLENNIRSKYISIQPNKHRSLVNHYKKFAENKPKGNSEEIITNICEYITSSYNIIRTHSEELSQLKHIFKNKQATEQGIIRLYTCLLNSEQIDYELVLTSNRFNHKFDSNFFSNSNLQTALIYFIEEKKYIEPDHVNTRLNFAPWETIGNYGVFINAEGRRFKQIEAPNAKDNMIKRDYVFTLDTDNVLATVNCKQQNTGYRATSGRGAYKYFKTRDLNEFKTFTGASGIEDVDFKNFEINNEALSLSANNTPLEINYTYQAESLIDEINEDFMLNFGKVIGTQNELYQESERINPIELRSLIEYKYTFSIPIPEGYEVKGLDDTKINRNVIINNDTACKFVSDYSIENNIITINVTEGYYKLNMDLKHYEDYKSVVNAAYDFSKKSILFKKL